MIKKLILPFIVLVVLVFSIIFVGSKISIVDNSLLPEPSGYPIEKNNASGDIMGTLEIFVISKDTNLVIPENRTVSMKELSTNPYYLIIEELKKGSETCVSPLASNVKVLSIELNKNTLYVNFSKEFTTQKLSNGLDNTISQCISKSFMNLKEVHNVVIQVEGSTDWF